MERSKVSPQGQTTIPSGVRDEVGIQPGTPLAWQVVQGKQGLKHLYVTPASEKRIKALRGIAGNLYKKYGGGAEYLKKERRAWEK